MDAAAAEITAPSQASPSPRKVQKAMQAVAQHEERHEEMAPMEEQEEVREKEEDDNEEDIRCSSARLLVLPRWKSEPTKMVGDAMAKLGAFWLEYMQKSWLNPMKMEKG